MGLRVSGTEQFKNLVEQTLRCLDIRIRRTGEILRLNKSAQSRIVRIKTRQLIEGLIYSHYEIIIEESSVESSTDSGGCFGNNTNPSNSECLPTHPGAYKTGSRVVWNPNQELPFGMRACRCIYLGHELCHAQQFILGSLVPTDRHSGRRGQIRYEVLNISGRYGSERAPLNAVTENDLRREHIPVQPPRNSL